MHSACLLNPGGSLIYCASGAHVVKNGPWMHPTLGMFLNPGGRWINSAPGAQFVTDGPEMHSAPGCLNLGGG